MTECVGKSATATGPLKNIAAEAMRLSLHVISRAGFGVRLEWPHEETFQHVPEGHTLSYKEALERLLNNIIPVMLTPGVILRNSPLQLHKVANEAYVEWGKYMREMYHDKRKEVSVGGEKREGMDLMGALVSGAGITAESMNDADPEKAAPGSSKQMLSDEEILGNVS